MLVYIILLVCAWSKSVKLLSSIFISVFNIALYLLKNLSIKNSSQYVIGLSEGVSWKWHVCRSVLLQESLLWHYTRTVRCTRRASLTDAISGGSRSARVSGEQFCQVTVSMTTWDFWLQTVNADISLTVAFYISDSQFSIINKSIRTMTETKIQLL